MKAILICGATGTGKSTVSHRLARELAIDQVIGSDTVREIARAYSSKDKHPSIYTSAILYTEEEHQDNPIYGFQKQAEEISPGIHAIIKRSEKENKDVIIEGIHPLPHLFEKNDNCIVIVLTTSSEEQHLAQLAGQGTDRSVYKIENFKKARAFQEYLVKEAHTHHAHVVENSSIDSTVEAIKKLVQQLH